MRAVGLVRPGMTLGLGTGSTTRHFIDGVGRLVAEGMKLQAVATSDASAKQARALGIRIIDQIEGTIDLAVDGADEVDGRLNLIKGRGGALAREKVVAARADRFVVVVDESKLVSELGVGVLPVEVLPFLWRSTGLRVAEFGAGWSLRGGEGTPFITDNGNLIIDLSFGAPISDPDLLGAELRSVVGVVEHGLFMGLSSACIVARASGVETLGSLH